MLDSKRRTVDQFTLVLRNPHIRDLCNSGVTCNKGRETWDLKDYFSRKHYDPDVPAQGERNLSELGVIGLEMRVLNPRYSLLRYPFPQKRGAKPHVEKNLYCDISS